MRESMARLTPRFSASRTVCEYTEQHYLPAAAAYRERAAEKGAVGMRIVDWQHGLAAKWAALRFGEVNVGRHDDEPVFEAAVYLGDLGPESIRVELYADGVAGGEPLRQEMKLLRKLADASGGYVYGAAVSADREAGDYTARLVPNCAGVAVPLEVARILWQR